MRVNEVKQTKTIEEVVRTEYIAEDGEVFSNEEECKKYEESALFAVSKQLKRLTEKPVISQYDINDDCSDEYAVEIFDIQSEYDLEILRRYLYLKMKKNGASENDVNTCFKSENEGRNNYVFDGVTSGHEVMIFWNYDDNYFWVYGDGSINGYCEFFKDRITKLIKPKEEKTE